LKLPLLAVMTALLLGAGSYARAGQMEDNRDALLKEAFMKNADWITDYDKAREESKKSGKAIFAYFTRSFAT
jgi:hypothetical protein